MIALLPEEGTPILHRITRLSLAIARAIHQETCAAAGEACRRAVAEGFFRSRRTADPKAALPRVTGGAG